VGTEGSAPRRSTPKALRLSQPSKWRCHGATGISEEPKKKAAFTASIYSSRLKSALTSLETGVALADHEHFAATANDFAVTVTRLRGLQRGKHLHG
jgi:hypothetical protein